ncbi:MAG: hypothetical protein ACI9XU_001781 [Arenicella sp.]|jgi:hypothetical protein
MSVSANKVRGFTGLSQTLLVLMILCAVSSASATTISLINKDSSNEGFNDNSAPLAGQTGNSGLTLGQQRLNVFKAAADYWAARIDSSVTIRVAINFDPLSCNSSSGILGSAGPNSVFRDFPGAPIANTWYVEAVVNSLAGFDGDGGSDDLGATFNSSVDNNNSCLFGTNWWYGINSPAPGGTISFFDTVLHEIAHGLGVLSLVGPNGARFFDRNDAYAYHLRDDQTGKLWRNMSDAQRAASAINTGNLVWDGPYATNNSSHLSSSSLNNGRIRMYAPNPYEGGSSVSHWDTVLFPDELMEPFVTPASDDKSTLQLLKDVGWNLLGQGQGQGQGPSMKITLAGIIGLLLDDD